VARSAGCCNGEVTPDIHGVKGIHGVAGSSVCCQDPLSSFIFWSAVTSLLRSQVSTSLRSCHSPWPMLPASDSAMLLVVTTCLRPWALLSHNLSVVFVSWTLAVLINMHACIAHEHTK